MPTKQNVRIAPAKGKLGVMIPGVGAVTTTFMAGLEAIKAGLGSPIGSLTQMAAIRLGKRTDNRSPKIKDFVPLAGLEDIVYTGWDIYEDNAYEAALNAGVLDRTLLKKFKGAAFGREADESRLRAGVCEAHQRSQREDWRIEDGTRSGCLMQDIKDFKKSSGASRLVMLWAASTETFHKVTEVHSSLKAFEDGLRKDDPHYRAGARSTPMPR